MLSETSLNIALPQLSKSLGISNATLQWIVTGYMLVIGIFLPLIEAIVTALATSLLQFGAHGAGVHCGIIFTIILAITGLAIVISINNQNEVHH